MTSDPRIGLIGLGAFGRLAARHLAPHCDLVGHDPAASGLEHGRLGTLADAASQPVVVLAVPVRAIAAACEAIAPHLAPDALVLDVASVKLRPMAEMRAALGPDVRIVGTHPLFGPQSAAGGIKGLPIVLCPDRGENTEAIERFLAGLGLTVHVSDADTHDRAMASVQALTHLVSKVIADLGLSRAPYTTRSHDLLIQAADLVAGDSDELFRAIERDNPHAADLRARFFEAARALDGRLGEGSPEV